MTSTHRVRCARLALEPGIGAKLNKIKSLVLFYSQNIRVYLVGQHLGNLIDGCDAKKVGEGLSAVKLYKVLTLSKFLLYHIFFFATRTRP